MKKLIHTPFILDLIKGVCIFSMIIFSTHLSYSQKHDENWAIGYYSAFNRPVNILSFKNKKFNIYSKNVVKKHQLGFTKISYSDGHGNLALITDGFAVYDSNFLIIPNGDSLNFNQVWKDYRRGVFPDAYSAIFLPDPIDTSITWLVHRSSEYGPKGYLDYNKLLFTKIKKINGKYNVISKNNVFFNKSVLSSPFMSIKHANGRDWWILQTKPKSNTYYIFLFDPNGIRLSHEQNIGEVIQSVENISNSADSYSQDGTKLAFYNIFSGIHLFDFDRCNGKLSNPVFTLYKWEYPVIFGSVAFSPSGRYLYFGNAFLIVQYDLWKYNGKLLHGDTVGRYDGFADPKNSPYFGHLMLAPDGKIYLCSAGEGIYMHVIHEPDKEGKLCNFVQRDFNLDGGTWSMAMPFMPSYRLGPLVGSSCDTLTTNNRKKYIFDVIWKNDDNLIQINYKQGELDGNLNFELYNLEGKFVNKSFLSFFETHWNIPMPELSSGLYFYRISIGERILTTGKIVISS